MERLHGQGLSCLSAIPIKAGDGRETLKSPRQVLLLPCSALCDISKPAAENSRSARVFQNCRGLPPKNPEPWRGYLAFCRVPILLLRGQAYIMIITQSPVFYKALTFNTV